MQRQRGRSSRRWTALLLALLAVAIGLVALLSTASAAGPALTLTTTGTLSGGVATYTFSVKNTGPTSLNPVSVTADTFNGQGAAPNTSVCAAQIGTLAAGATKTCTVTYTVTQADLNSGPLHLTAVTFTSGAPFGISPTPSPRTKRSTFRWQLRRPSP